MTVWKNICEITLDDGIKFDGDALRADPIREQLEYGGLRLRTTAALASARISITVDIGFGDSVEPGVEKLTYPYCSIFPRRVCARTPARRSSQKNSKLWWRLEKPIVA